MTRTHLRRVGLLCALVAAATALLAPGSAAAAGGLTCAPADASRPFLRWLDPFEYTLAPGGDFESGAEGWTLTGGARVVEGNEPFGVSGGGSHSLYLPAGSTAETPPMCVSLDRPTLRFFAQGGGLLAPGLRIEAIHRTLLGLEVALPVLLPVGWHPAWAPTLPLPFLANITGILTLDGLTTEVRFRFRAESTYRIDDVFVDPWRTT
jgi:hypothetical protein